MTSFQEQDPEKPWITHLTTGCEKAPEGHGRLSREADIELQRRLEDIREAERKAWQSARYTYIR